MAGAVVGDSALGGARKVVFGKQPEAGGELEEFSRAGDEHVTGAVSADPATTDAAGNRDLGLVHERAVVQNRSARESPGPPAST